MASACVALFGSVVKAMGRTLLVHIGKAICVNVAFELLKRWTFKTIMPQKVVSLWGGICVLVARSLKRLSKQQITARQSINNTRGSLVVLSALSRGLQTCKLLKLHTIRRKQWESLLLLFPFKKKQKGS